MSISTEQIQLEARVPDELAGQRLDQVAARLFADFSRSRLTEWIKDGSLTVNGKSLRPRDTLYGGERLQLDAEQEAQGEWLAQAIELDVVYEDEHLLVINKPAGLVVHPAAGHASGTLLNALLHHAPQVRDIPRAGIVHRLDKDTSGILVVAKSLLAHARLVEQLQARSMGRTYEALVMGVVTSGGTIDAPIGRHPQQRQKMGVTEGGKQAISHFRVVQRFRSYTHVRVQLETGRTHQIRVHMAHAGFPLVGDPLYGGRFRIPPAASPTLVEALKTFPRQALHAWKLELDHPATGQRMSWQVARPEDMDWLLHLLEEDAGDFGA
ncbi:MAG: 23S rRNA pseudouridine(1911/1915/1917) synthase RluD [Thiopseudomonas sp.]|nr:23S rRNA pseudouridine(1911/1915/1917) synthase RluD [Thiopseudomonas sp.]